MKNLTRFMMIAVATVMAFGCTEEIETNLSVVSTELTAPAEGVVLPIKFNANAAWTAASDSDWVTLSKESGEAGNGQINVTVAANDTYEDRTAVITITADDKEVKYTVKQKMCTSFEAEFVYEISAEAQTIEFAMTSNVDYSFTIAEDAKSWISESGTKAAPAESVKKFSIKANGQISPREGVIAVKAGDSVFGMIVRQNSEFNYLTKAEASCIGRTMKIYDGNTWAYSYFTEFVITLADEEENTLVKLAVNAADAVDVNAIPAGEYLVDATAEHAENTFSIKPLDGSEPEYTGIVENGTEILVEDGQITITEENGVYTILAVLVDDKGNEHRYSYSGSLEVADNSFGGYISSVAFSGQYDTYYTTKANAWDVTLQLSKAPTAEDLNVNYIDMTLYGATGEVNSDELPSGTFTLAESTISEEVAYANGIYLFKTGDMTIGVYSDNGDYSWTTNTGSTVTVTKNDDGTYKFDFDLNLSREVWNDDGTELIETKTATYKATADNIRANYGEVKMNSMPQPDGDAVFSTIMSGQAAGLYYGNKETFGALPTPLAWSETGSLIIMWFNYIDYNYTIYLPLNVPNWTFEKNFSNYCNTPPALQTYEFSNTVKDGAILPVNIGSTLYHYVQNNYTGTKMAICGGSITLAEGTVTYNLEAKSPVDGKVYKFTGSHAYSFYYARDYSAANRASQVKLVTE